MGVLAVYEEPKNEFQEEASSRNSQRVFRVRVSSPYDGRAEIAASGMIPEPYTLYDGQMLKSRQFKRRKGLKSWEVVCSYSTEMSQKEMDYANNPNPLTRPCVIDIVTLREQVPAYKDRNGNALVNVLGRPYDPPLMRWRTRLRFECEKNTADYPSWYFSLADCINEFPFAIRGHTFDEKTLLFCTDRIPDKQLEGSYSFFASRFAIEWTPEGWDPEVLQADYYQAGSGPGGLTRITEDGVPVSTVRKLDEMGEVIDSEDPEDAFYETEEIQLLSSFSVLTGVLS